MDNNSNAVSNTTMIFNNSTKNICLYCFISIILIILFTLTPLSNFVLLTTLIKITSILLLGYCIYLNSIQIKNFYTIITNDNSALIKSYLNINILCSCIFSLSMIIFIFFIMKSFWY
jgi:hypothetical protein